MQRLFILYNYKHSSWKLITYLAALSLAVKVAFSRRPATTSWRGRPVLAVRTQRNFWPERVVGSRPVVSRVLQKGINISLNVEEDHPRRKPKQRAAKARLSQLHNRREVYRVGFPVVRRGGPGVVMLKNMYIHVVKARDCAL